MTPKQLLTNSWSTNGFLYEFLAVFTLIFFIAIWIFFAKLNKKENNKLYMTFGFAFATFLMFVIPWSWSFFLSYTRTFALGNPIVVLLQAILQGINVTKKTFEPIFNGVGYLIAGEILGGIAGFILFIPIFYLLKHFFKGEDKYSDIAKNISLINIFKIDNRANKRTGYFAVKETIFISLFTTSIPLLNYINQTSYGATHFDKMLISVAVIAFTIYISSYFGYYAFHIFFAFMNLVLSLIYFLYLKAHKTDNTIMSVNKHMTIQNLQNFVIVALLSGLIPIVFGLIVTLITKHSGAGLNF